MFENESTQEVSDVTSDVAQETQTTEQPSILDLDSGQYEKFKWDGKEWDRNDFRNAYLMQQDYTKKTQTLSEERKYYDNLEHDLETVKRNPEAAKQFLSVYPKKFHRFLDYVKQPVATTDKVSSMKQSPQQSDEVTKLLERIDQLEGRFRDTDVAKLEQDLDAKFEKFGKDYAYADQAVVISRAQALIDQGHVVSDDVFKKLFKESNDHFLKKAEEHYSKRVQEQKTVNAKAKDVPSGGGIPGSAPKVARNIKEASDIFRRDLGA
jgi:hypothetical protein